GLGGGCGFSHPGAGRRDRRQDRDVRFPPHDGRRDEAQVLGVRRCDHQAHGPRKRRRFADGAQAGAADGAGVSEKPYKLIERHTSPDKFVDLVVFQRQDDWIVGFVRPGSDATVSGSGWSWHTHGDILVHQYGGTPESATKSFVADVLSSNRVMVIFRVDGVVQDITVTNEPDEDDLKYASANETVEKRFWNGLPYVTARA